MKKEKNKSKKILKGSGILFVSLFILLATYLGETSLGDKTAQIALASDDSVKVEETLELIIFKPLRSTSNQGLIFYPGGKVQSTAYAPMMREFAEKGITSVIVKMPFNLAIFDVDGADKGLVALPEIKDWVIAGHSLGGAMAGDYLSDNPEKFQGIVFMASYPNKSLSDIQVPALSIYGTEDHVLNKEAFLSGKEKMPMDSNYLEIDGGNHSNFGNYGIQQGDGVARISNQQQQKMVVEAVVNRFFNR
ncbi:MAG: alpha/beta hydrolase [Eubacteriaceae bacterium]